jgi:hypothetical protein
MALHQVFIDQDTALFSEGAVMFGHMRDYLKKRYPQLLGVKKELVIPLQKGKILVRFWIDQSVVVGKNWNDVEKRQARNYIGLYESTEETRKDAEVEESLKRLARVLAEIQEPLVLEIFRKSKSSSD